MNQSLIQETAIDGIPLWKEPLSSPAPGRIFGPVSVLDIAVVTFALAVKGLVVGVYEDGIPFASTTLEINDATQGAVPLYPTCAPAVIGTRVYVLATSSAPPHGARSARPDPAPATCALVALDMRESLSGRLRQVWTLPYNCSQSSSGQMRHSADDADALNPLMALTVDAEGSVLIFGAGATDATGTATPTVTAVLDPADASARPHVMWRAPLTAALRTLTLSTHISPCANTSLTATLAPRATPVEVGSGTNLTVWATLEGSTTLLLVDVRSGDIIKRVDIGALVGAGATAFVSSAHVLAAPCTPGGGALVAAVTQPGPSAPARGTRTHRAGDLHHGGMRTATATRTESHAQRNGGNGLPPGTHVIALDADASRLRWRVPLPPGDDWDAWNGRFSVVTPTPPHKDDGASVLVLSGVGGVLAIGVPQY